jgi:hypothetical protein
MQAPLKTGELVVADFEIFRSKHNPAHYVAVLSGDRSENAMGVRDSQNLFALTRIPDDGQAHLGFDPGIARATIDEHGFYAFAVTVEPRDGHD